MEHTDTVLLVDDDELIREMGRDMLQDAGYRVLVAEGGNRAIELFRAHSDEVDGILLDQVMPDLSGEETLRELRKISAVVPVVLTSGRAADPLDESLGVIAGFLKKPYSPDQLIDTVRRALHG